MFWLMTLTHPAGHNVVNRTLTAIHASMSAQQASTMGMFLTRYGLSSTRGREQRLRTGPPITASACSTNARRNRRPSRRMYTKQRWIISSWKVFPAFRPRRRCSVCQCGQRTSFAGALAAGASGIPLARPAAGRCRGNSPSQAASCSYAAAALTRPSRVNTSICPRCAIAETCCATMILYRIGKLLKIFAQLFRPAGRPPRWCRPGSGSQAVLLKRAGQGDALFSRRKARCPARWDDGVEAPGSESR